jgi:phosphatidylglycerol:prolipoprotein diacylglycerol transferase
VSPGSGAAVERDYPPAALAVAHWLETGPAGGPPYTAVIRVTGRRRGVIGPPTKGDSFVLKETVPGVVPGSGRVALTSWVYDINQGEWDVTAELVGPERARAATPDLHLPQARWSWRTWSLGPAVRQPVRTRWAAFAPLAVTPVVVPGSFTALAVVAILAAIVSQPAFHALVRVDSGAAALASVAGLFIGLAGAKAWYMALKGPSRRTLREGWSVDGFLVTAPIAAAVLAGLQGIDIGAYLDGATPGIFLAVAIGRVGCFLTGCCAGRATAGLGIWSSDRRVCARRIPAQLLESAAGLALAVTSAGLLIGRVGGSGLLFILAGVIYVAARQVLLRLRAEARPFSWRRAQARVAAGG